MSMRNDINRSDVAEPFYRGCPWQHVIRRHVCRVIRTVFHVWPDRYRQRIDLRNLEDFQLKDIGISRENALRESRKRFWR